MQIEVLGAYGGESMDCRMTCLLINEKVALDAGSLSQAIPIERQKGVESILLTHSHMDHTSSLPFFTENVYSEGTKAIDIYGSTATIYAVRKHLFNNAAWPDFSRLPNHLLPTIRFHELTPELPLLLNGVTFTPIEVDHLVPTFGFLIDDGTSSVLWSSDTGPTTRLWEIANQTKNLRAIFVETSFENSLQKIADISYHLTPNTLRLELEKLETRVPILLHHLKPPSEQRIRAEVKALNNPDLGFLEQGKIYKV